MGYEAYREQVFARQRRMGVITDQAELSPVNPYIDVTSADGKGWPEADTVRPWDSLSDGEKQLFGRMAEVYAGFLSHADHHIGRLPGHLEASGQLDNTIIVLVSDNGASGEGGPNGSVNENKFFNGVPDTIEANLPHLDELGSPATYNHYPTGWAMAFNTPFKLWKRYSPEAVLAALIIHAVSHLMKAGEMRRYHRLVPREFWLAMLTLLGVIVLDVLPALIIGVVIALLLLVYQASRPRVSMLGADPRVTGVFADLSRHPGIVPVPGVLIVRPDAPLLYANAEMVRDAIENAVVSSAEPVRAVVLVLDGNDNLDITSAEQLGKLAGSLAARNVPLGLAHVHGPALEMAERSGLLATVGADRVFPTTPAAVAWAQAAADAPAPG
jgi:CBS domain-containing protein